MKYKLLKIRDRVITHRFSAQGSLEAHTIITECCSFQGGRFASPGEADEFRSLKDHPGDYLIVSVW